MSIVSTIRDRVVLARQRAAMLAPVVQGKQTQKGFSMTISFDEALRRGFAHLSKGGTEVLLNTGSRPDDPLVEIGTFNGRPVLFKGIFVSGKSEAEIEAEAAEQERRAEIRAKMAAAHAEMMRKADDI